MKRVALHIFKEFLEYDGVEDALQYSNICKCNYIKDEDIESCEECVECENECLLTHHIDDKNVHKNVELKYEDIDYPCVVCFADTHYKDERITICSISDAKDHTKYRYSDWW